MALGREQEPLIWCQRIFLVLFVWKNRTSDQNLMCDFSNLCDAYLMCHSLMSHLTIQVELQAWLEACFHWWIVMRAGVNWGMVTSCHPCCNMRNSKGPILHSEKKPLRCCQWRWHWHCYLRPYSSVVLVFKLSNLPRLSVCRTSESGDRAKVWVCMAALWWPVDLK